MEMFTRQNLGSLWLLLLHIVAGSALKFNLFREPSGPVEGDVRLSGFRNDSEGRVEIYHEGRWGTVCDDGWGMSHAQVVCRQLQFPRAKSVVIGTDYGEASGPLWLDDVKCKGTETHLSACDFKAWGLTDCSHKEDVGVICETADGNVSTIDSTHSLDHTIYLSNELGQIFDSGIGCDFVILAQSETGNKEEDGSPEIVETKLCLHKLFLSQFPSFNLSEGTTSFVISQSCQPYLSSFFRYIYTLKIEVTFSSVQCLHWMASKFGVKQLKEDTGRLFSKILPEDVSFRTQVSLYKYAGETGDFGLEENCVQFLAWNFQSLTKSPAWASLSTELLSTLLIRSDLVVPDEYFLLQTVEGWITEKGNSVSLETQVDLLGRIRFPMIPSEKLYELEFNSSLYSTHKNMYEEKMLKALMFNLLLFENLLSNPKFNKGDDDYKHRIYTAQPWSVVIDETKKNQPKPYLAPMRNRGRYNYNHYYVTPSPSTYYLTESFSTPAHTSLIFKDNKVSWEANIFKWQSACSDKGLTCESLPLAWLDQKTHFTQQANILFHNRLLLMCQDKYICHVQDFKVNLAHISVNGTHVVTYPCPDDQYSYYFVLRPEVV